MKHIKILLFIILGISTKLFAQCPVISISGTNVNCHGGSTGTITTSVSGGSGNYTYAWNNGEVTPNLSGLEAGIYFVNVTDLVSGCTSMNLYTVTEPDLLLAFTSVQNVNCFGQATGNIDLMLLGGTAPFNYQWSNNQTTQDLNNIAAGFYAVNISDQNGCTTSTSATVTETASIVNSNISFQSVSCPQGSDGSVDLTVFGGEPPYTFNWNNNTYLSEDISGLTTGLYSVLITDGLGCTSNNSITVTEPTAIQSSISGTDVLCFGTATGAVNLSPSGGTPPYNYNWTNTMFTLGAAQDLNNIYADTYHVTITDARGCTAQNSIIINEPPQLSTILSGQNISCYGYSDGSITQIVSGGSAPYTYSWFDINGILSFNTQDINGLIAGNYQVIISDFYACTYTSNITLTQPLLPLSSSIVGTDVKCFGDNSGTADLSVEGGTAPYQYSWSNGYLYQDQPNLFSGNYTATVVDTNGCISISTVIISQPAAPVTSSHTSTPVTCYGLSDGAINFTINGGTAPYTYSWVNSQFALSVVAQDITDFPAENYTLTITDANQCVLVDSATITQPDLLQISINPTHILCYGDSTGALDLTINGGVPGYNVLWNNNAVTSDQYHLFSGYYHVLVNDQNGCFTADSVILNQPAAPLSSTYYAEKTNCFGFQDGYIFYDVQGGTLPYHFLWSNGDTVSNIFDLNAGIYEITTTDGHNCVLIDSIEVLQPEAIIINSSVTDAQCAGSNTGSIDISVTGGTLPYSYLWMNSTFVLSTIDEDLIEYPAENYVITVTDSLGCTGTSQINILEPDSIKISLVASNISCGGASDGSIDVDISGGIQPYTYDWSNGAITEDVNNLPAGVYLNKVTDAYGCFAIEEYTLSEVPKLNIVLNIVKPSCNLVSDGSVTVEVSNGTGAYTYLWDEGADTTFKYEKLKAGEYKLRVTDAAKCSQDTIAIVPYNPVECIEIPSAFTPNGDGKNDFWQIKNIDLFPACKVSIFNNWGNRVFENQGYKEMWDGRFFNNKLPPETYYYIIDLADGNDPRTGTVSIIY